MTATPARQGEVATKYAKLEGLRNPYLERAREAAKLTIPSLIPPEGGSGSTRFKTPYQGLGARGVNNLSSKLLLALFPPNSPFFRLSIGDFQLEKLTKRKGMRAQIEEAFGQIERSVMSVVETAARTRLFEALKHLIVGGNVLLHIMPSKAIRAFRLNQYVVKRDPVGNLLEIIVKERVSPLALPREIRVAVDIESENESPEDNLDLYTYIHRASDGTEFKVHQELNGMIVPGSDGTYPVDRLPWLPLRWSAVENEDYGRGFCEEYMGDLKSLEGLSKAMLEAAAAASKIVFFVKPTSSVSVKKLREAPNGSILDGNIDDVGALQLEKYADMRIAFEQAQEITKRLSYSFMLNSSVQRSGERVTAEEIRYMAGELEDALGGVYSILSQELQLPLVMVLMDVMTKQGELPELPNDLVKPTITTGMEALGRGHDLNKLSSFINQLSPLGPEVLSQYMNIGDYISRVGTSLGIDTKGLVKSQEEIEAERRQAMMMQMGQQMAPEMMKGMMQQANPNG